jgi:hypothetical protein
LAVLRGITTPTEVTGTRGSSYGTVEAFVNYVVHYVCRDWGPLQYVGREFV